MYKVKFLASGDIFDLIGFNGDKIIIRFNNGQSVGTVPKTGYKLLAPFSWEITRKQIELNILGQNLKEKIDGRYK